MQRRAKSSHSRLIRRDVLIYSNDVLNDGDETETKHPALGPQQSLRPKSGFRQPYKTIEQAYTFNRIFRNDELFHDSIKHKMTPILDEKIMKLNIIDKNINDVVIKPPFKKLPSINQQSDQRQQQQPYELLDNHQEEEMWNVISQQIADPSDLNFDYEVAKRSARKKKKKKQQSMMMSSSRQPLGQRSQQRFRRAFDDLDAVDRGNIKAIRIFVSSTFTDFFSEREILVKQVFPELREWCYDRNLDIIECDLRWGVPIDSTSDETILTCMSEIDRCYEDNNQQPFFVGMLSEKYGWVPDAGKLSEEIVRNYNWVNGASITFMEFLHGALRSKNKNACFLIRDRCSLDGIPDEFKEKFFEMDAASKRKLETEKEMLRKYHPNQVFDYHCKYDCIDASTGRKKVKMTGLNEFGQTVLRFLKQAIDSAYPDLKKIINDSNRRSKEGADEKEDNHDGGGGYDSVNAETEISLLIEDLHQQAFLRENSKFFIGRQNQMKELLDYIHHDSSNTNPDAADKKLFVIIGDEGCGKTSLVANLINQLDDSTTADQMQMVVFYHFYDATAKSQTTENLAYRFVKQFSIYSDEEDLFKKYMDTQLVNRDKLIVEVCEAINKTAADEQKNKFVLIIDGMERDFSFNLNFLPADYLTSPNIKIIYTVNSNCKQRLDLDDDVKQLSKQETIQSKIYKQMNLDSLDLETSKQFVQTYLAKFNKRLDEKQMSLLLSSKFGDGEAEANVSPLWLKYACNELRIFGEFTMVTKLISEMPVDINGLLKMTINRMNADFKNDIVKKVLCMIYVSGAGLPESDSLQLFQNFNSIEQEEKDEEKNNNEEERISADESMNTLLWSHIMRNLKPILCYSQFYNTQLIKFAHSRLCSIVSEHYLQNNAAELMRPYHLKLADYYRNACKYREFACNQISKHYIALKNLSGLFDFLMTREAFCFLNSVRRSMTINEIRCKAVAVDDSEEYRLRMCFTCQTRMGHLSCWTINKSACYLCGTNLFGFNGLLKNLYALVCLNHRFLGIPDGMFRCCICLTLKNKSGSLESSIAPTYAFLCTFCYNTRQCACLPDRKLKI